MTPAYGVKRVTVKCVQHGHLSSTYKREEAVPLDEFVPAAPYAEPTFNPESSDGYGPVQALPPVSVRFPDQFER